VVFAVYGLHYSGHPKNKTKKKKQIGKTHRK
jgi:hypothetical protein